MGPPLTGHATVRRKGSGLLTLLAITAILGACTSAVSPSASPSRPAAAQSGAPNSTEPPVPGASYIQAPAATTTPETISSATLTPTPASNQQPSGEVRLMAAGDTMLARSIGKRLRADPDAPLAGVAGTFAKADLTLLNLECTISDRGTPNATKAFTFRAPPVSATALADAGVDIVSLANNHSLDYGPKALADTISLLGAKGIGTIGAGADSAQARAPLILERNGLRVAFLAYLEGFTDASGWSALSWEATASRPGVAIARLAHISRDVAAAKEQADVVVVMFHSGLAQIAVPTSLQRRLASTALAAGAALVVEASPHRLQGTRRQGNTFIAYSLGNFVFDQSRGVFNDSVILDVTLDKNGVKSVRFVPVVIRDGFPKLAHGADATRILKELRPI